MLVLVVHTEALRALALHAAALLGLAPIVAAPGTAAATLRAGRRAAELAAELTPGLAAGATLLVHDFAPDAEASVRWLDALVDGAPGLGVLALLPTPAGGALHLLVGHPHRFTCVDVVLGREATARTLAERLQEAHRTARHAAVARALAAGWPLDPLLLAVARRAFELAEPGHAHGDGGRTDGGRTDGARAEGARAEARLAWPTLQRLLDDVGVTRRTFVRHATRAGFHPPLRFLQVIRVLGAAAALHRGDTATSAASRFGYGSTGTLRRHFATIVGLTPRDARHLAPADLVGRIRAAPPA